MILQKNGTFSSTKWNVISSIINGVISIVIGAILARLLTPEFFGLIAIALLIVSFAVYFVKLGIGPALIQKENLTSEDVSFAISFSLVIGFLATIMMSLLSPLIASLFKKPESTLIIAAMSLSLWLTSFSGTIIGLLRRHMEFKFLSIVSIAQTILYGSISILMAKLGFGVWSLVWSLIISQFLALIAFFVKIKAYYIIKPRFSVSGHGHLLRFGTKYAAISILEYFGSNSDTIFVGRFFSASQLGIYNKAYKLAYLPSEILITSITSVMFPVFSRLQNQIEKFKQTQIRLFLFIGLISTCIAMGMLPAAKNIVLVLYGSQWLASVPILAIVLFAVPFDFMSASIGLTFDALGKLNEKIMIQIIALVVLFIGFTFLYQFGLVGIAISLVISHALRFLLYMFINQKVLSISTKTILKNIALIILAGVSSAMACRIVVIQTGYWSIPPIPAFFLEIFTCLVIFLVFLYLNSPTLLGVNNLTESHTVIRSFLNIRGENKIGR